MAHPRYVGLRLSTQAGAVPTAADMAEGELAINTADGRVYTLAGSTIIDLTDRYTVSEIDTLLDGKANASHTHPWGEVTGKPDTATRWPAVAEVAGLTAALFAKLDAANRYTDAEAVAAMQAAPEWHAAYWDAAFGWGDHALAGYLKSVAWGDVGGKPAFAEVATSGAYGDLSGTPSLGTAASLNAPVSGDAAADEAVKGSDSRLRDSRPPTSHTHTLADISDAGTAAAEDAADFDPAGAASSAVSGHESAPDPHSQYVKKATGKGLSSNDYTDGDKSKLAGIESGATADQTKADIDALGIDADTLDGKRADDFDPAGAAADAEQRIRQTLNHRPDPLLMHFL